MLSASRHVEVVRRDGELLHVGCAGQVVVVGLVSLLALVIDEAERMLTLLVQLLAHRWVVALGLR